MSRLKFMDRAIDVLVYEWYGLTEEEIKVVEGEWRLVVCAGHL